jgi:hypothetical protein
MYFHSAALPRSASGAFGDVMITKGEYDEQQKRDSSSREQQADVRRSLFSLEAEVIRSKRFGQQVFDRTLSKDVAASVGDEQWQVRRELVQHLTARAATRAAVFGDHRHRPPRTAVHAFTHGFEDGCALGAVCKRIRLSPHHTQST